ncbi:MAG: PIN domain-containing protein [Microcystis aeruginosa G13-07]|nr:PIN domain-containing protein [Microcystis aeruginosa G13-11]NCS08902.1 PIN domain-containing protein [Microcystis aeruginosa G13-07]
MKRQPRSATTLKKWRGEESPSVLRRRGCQIYYLWRPNLKDEADNHLVELAIAGSAGIIVTNNIRDFHNTELLFPELSILKPENLIQS